jgi:hypothetical protein
MKWNIPSIMRRLFKPARQRTIRNAKYRCRPHLESLESRLAPANVSVTSFHYDPGLTGANLQETVLTPSNVNQTTFGRVATVLTDGYSFATPLYVANLNIGGTMHNVAYVSTEHDSVYAFDIVNDPNSPTGVTITTLWQHSFITGGPMGPTTPGITTVPNGEVGTGDIVPEIGITGSPVIDTATGTLYVIAKTKEVRADGTHYVQTLHALNITTGADVTTPYVIGDSKGDGFNNQTTSIVVAGGGADSSIPGDPVNGRIAFNALRENERSSLILLNGRVYVAYASHGDNNPYHGWVIGFNEASLQPEKVFNTTPNAQRGGIWQSQGAIATDGTFLYVVTGNANNGPFPGFDPTHGDYGETALKLDPSGLGTAITVASYFTPNEWQTLDNNDADFGSGGLMLLPAAVGSAAHPNLGVAVGKTGKIYLLDTTPGHNMGGNVPAGQADNVVQVVTAGPGGVWGTPAFYQTGPNSGYIYYHGSGTDTRAFFISNGVITPSSPALDSNQTFGFPGAQPIISANGAQNGSTAIDWELQVDNYSTQGPATLHAYVADPSSGTVLTELYNSNQAGARDAIGSSVKFTSATETNGEVFVAQEYQFSVFGLFPTHTAVPAAPTGLSGMGVSASAVQLNWTSPSPNTATGIKIFRSTDNDQNFQLVTTVSAAATSYTDNGVTSGHTYFYKIAATNQVGDSPQTAEIQASPLISAPVLSLFNVTSANVTLQWTLPPVANDHYTVQRSQTADFANPTTLASNIPGNQLTYTDNDPLLVSQPGTYYYRVIGFTNPAGTGSATSNVVTARVGPGSANIDYGNGFPVNPFDLQANGTTEIGAESTLRLTPGLTTVETGSAFSVNQENILSFDTDFSVRLHEGTQPSYADGFAFVIQANSPFALGQGTTGLGYQGILHSLAITFDTYSNGFAQVGPSGGGTIGLFFNGDNPAGTLQPGEVRIPLNSSVFNLNTQDTLAFSISYDYNAANPGQSVLHLQVLDTTLMTSFAQDFHVDIPSMLGSPLNGNTVAYVGFTGSTGGPNPTTAPLWELQDIKTWRFTPNGPAAPHGLSANATSNANDLSWKATSADEAGYYVERSTSATSGFSRIATLAAGVTTYHDDNNGAGLTNPMQYFYRVQAFNHAGSGMSELDSGYSNVASSNVVNIPFGGGFPSTMNLASNGFGTTSPLNGTVLRVTDAGGSEARSVYYTTPVGTGTFSTTFVLRDQPQNGSADSVSFVMQGNPAGLTALGGSGGAGGYAGITNSIAIKFDLYSGGTHTPTTGLYMNGQSPGQAPGGQSIALGTGINLGQPGTPGDPLQVTLAYDGTGMLTETVTDTITHAVFTQTYAINISQTIGTNRVYVGFTGGTGGESANQDILSWTGQFQLAPPQASSFTVSANPTSITAGQTTQVTVTAKDQNGNPLPGYTGTVHFTSSDGQAVLPANYQFTAADMGVHVFTVTLKTAGNDTITVTDAAMPSVTGSASVAVSPAATSAFAVTGFPVFIAPGGTGTFTVRATDAFGNTTPTYTGTVHFTSSDPMATLPADYTFMAGENGVHSGFTATLRTVGIRSITATDTATPAITGTQSGINVQSTGTTIDFSNGFANHSNLTANGSTSFPTGTTVARLTDGGGTEAASLFYNTPVGPGAFSTTFTLRDQPVNGAADSVSFVLQADPRGTAALGASGGAGGYGPGDTTVIQPPAIVNSIAVKFDLYTHGSHNPTTGLFIGGQAPAQFPAQDVPLTGINLGSGDPLTVTLNYDGTTLHEVVTDTVTHQTFTHDYALNLFQVIGGNTAYVGFTGGTGGETAIQDILNWTGSFQQAGGVTIDFSGGFANHGNLTANTTSQSPPLNAFPPSTVSPNFPNFNTPTGFVTNGSATFTGTPTVLQLTDGGGGEAASAWYTTQVLAGNFTTTFTLQDQPVGGAADNLNFVIQADPRGTAALGTGGGDGGYAGIQNSIAIKFDLYSGGTHTPTTGLYMNGQSPGGAPGGQSIAMTGINLGSNDPLRVTLTYNGTTLTETVLDTVTMAMFSQTYTLNLAQLIGTGPAYVGFTGGTGGETAIQKITSWTGTFQAPQVLQLTDGRAGEATTVFDNTPIGTGAFNTTFVLKDQPVSGAADGVSFIIQADPSGTAALGGAGGGEGYAGITHSIAVKFDLYSHGTHNPTTGLFIGGQSPDSDPTLDVPLTGINLGSGDPLQVTLTYDGVNLTEMVTDTVTHATFMHTYALNLTQVIGGNSAYVGFGGGTGGETATQQILSWMGTFSPAQAAKLLISAPSTVVAGAPFQVTVTALDQNNNQIPGYLGTVHFTSSDPAPGLPANYSFRASDNGVHTFTVSLNTLGSQSITVTDTATMSITGTQSGILVNQAGLTIDYSGGFGNQSNLTRNGSATFVGPTASPVGIFAGHQDVGTAGDPSVAGNATFSNGVYTLTASGSDIWGTADHMQYLYMPLSGNGQITARLLTETPGVNDFAKAGVMFRDSLDAGASNAFMLQFPNPGSRPGWPTYQWRATDGGTTADHEFQTAESMPLWLRLVRSGNTFIGYWAVDNNGTPGTWQLLGSETVTMGATAYVGLGVTSHQNGQTVTATFDHASVTGATAPLPSTTARLTDGGGSEAGSIFTNNRVADASFTTTFVLRDQPVTGAADSLSFVLQADPRGATALGGGGGGGGYQGIQNSIAIKFDLYSGGTHTPTTGLYINGALPGGAPGGSSIALTGINLGSGDPLQVTLTYNGTTLTETVTDTVTHAVFTHDYLINIPQTIGSLTAYAGFTAGTGGETSLQDVLSWTGSFSTVVPEATSLSVSVSTNLVRNGGFETGDFTGWTRSGDTSADSVIADTDPTHVHSGTYSYRSGPDNLVFLTQTLATVAGVSYNLDFWLSNPIGGAGTEWLAKVGGNTLMDVTDAPAFNFTHYTFTFTATGSSTDLQFGTRNSPDWFYLDDVSVTPTIPNEAGVPVQVTVTALDANGKQVGYTGTVHFASSDPQAVLPANYSFTSSDNGQHTFMVTLKTAGNEAVSITDTAHSQLSAFAGVVVNPAPASTLRVTGFGSPTTAGTVDSVLVTAYDPYGNVATGYRGTVHLTSSDPQAQLEADHTFTAADGGRYAFGATLKTVGTRSITATDTATASITGSQTGIVVNPAAASRFVVSTSPSTVTAGGSTTVTVTAYDAYGNVATGYSGTVHFTSSDPQAVLPANATLTNGTGTFSATLKKAGSQTITATDTVNSSVTGAAAVTVTPAAASYLVVAGYPSPANRMEANTFTVTAHDIYGNVATGYLGTVTFSSDESHADLPSDYTFTAADAGVHTFSATFNRFGTFYLRVTDTANPSITGEQDGISVV